MSVLVVTWNSSRVLPGMLATLERAAPGLELELVQVDNASADESVAVPDKHWRGRLVRRVNDENLGFAAALKQATHMANGEFLLMLNPDARLHDGALGTLVARLRSDSSLGAAGPLLRWPDGELQLDCARRSPRLLGAFAEMLGMHRLVGGTFLDPNHYPRASYARERNVPCLSGAAMLIRRTALESAGGVDDRFFMYFEDIDICERLRRSGFGVRFCPSAQVTHISAASSPLDPSLEVWLAVQQEAATNAFLAVHRGPLTALAHRALVAVKGASRALVYAVASRLPGRLRVQVPASGIAKMRWALWGQLPGGSPG